MPGSDRPGQLDRRRQAVVLGEPGIRFYAGAQLRLTDGANVGALCVIDRAPRQLTDEQLKILKYLAGAATKALEKRRDHQLALAQSTDAMPAMLHTIDVDGRLLTVSNRWLDRLGYKREDVLGQKSIDFVGVRARPGWAGIARSECQSRRARWQKSPGP